jgi:hypothetical protein
LQAKHILPQSWLKIYGKSSIARFISLFLSIAVELLKTIKLRNLFCKETLTEFKDIFGFLAFGYNRHMILSFLVKFGWWF